MDMDPYKELGVARKASDELIRSAYKRRAKKAHPDGGGSAAAFNRLKFARDLLLDPQRRRTFDESGRVSQPASSNSADHAKALQIISASMLLMIHKVLEEEADITRVDAAKWLRLQLKARLEQFRLQRQRLEKLAATAEKLKGRFARRRKIRRPATAPSEDAAVPGNSLAIPEPERDSAPVLSMDDIIAGHLLQFQRDLTATKEAEKAHDNAYNLVESLSFRVNQTGNIIFEASNSGTGAAYFDINFTFR